MFTFPIAHFGGALDYTIDQSIRFNDDDSAYLEWSGYSGSPTSGTDCTFSFWVKRCRLGATQVCIYGGDASGSTYEGIRFDSDDQFRVFQASSAYDLITSQAFVDPSAWSHFVVAFDTDNSTAADRIKIYHNGVRITDFSLQTNPSSGYVTNFNTGGSGEAIQIGREGGNSQFLDGYLAEINFVDGQALDPTSFGETDSDSGQFIPKKYAGSYGTNGYYLKGEDSSDLGNDSSGNNNDFTSNNLAAADQVSDSPTNNFCVLSPIDEFGGGLTLSDGNLKAVPSASTYCNNHGTFYIDSGKWVFECKHTTVFGEACGWSPPQELISGSSDRGYFMFADGRAFDNVTNTGTKGASLASGDFRYVFYDADAQAMWFAHVDVSSSNALVYDNSATKAEIEAGTTTNAVFTNIPAGLWAPGIWMDTSGVIEVNFGQSDFATTSDLPSGFNTLCAANLSDPTIANGSEYFHPQTYTGTGSSGLAITNDASAGDFKPDILWLAPRSNGDNKVFFDSVRGTTQRVKSNAADAEDTDGTAQLTFEADGFDLDTTDVNFNGSGRTYVAWQWHTNGGTTSSNTDGSITSTVSANATAGVSIVTYTGTGANATVGHSLNTAPKMLLIKNRTDTDSWVVYHDALGATKGLAINNTDAPTTASTFFNNTAPTSSVFSVGIGGRTNGSSKSMLCYCFAEVEGFSKFGSYTGNGSTDGPFVYTGFKPRWVLFRRYDAAEGWSILDTARGSGNFGSDAGSGGTNPTAGNDMNNKINANDSAGEEDNPTGSRRASFLSNGFKLRTTNTAMNASGDYLYMAFAESPFKTATAR